MTTLEINSTNGYLNLSDLPHNCIFNKVVTGCGGTTIVLENDQNYVIAVPTTELIINKCGSKDAGLSPNRNLFGLHGAFTYQLKRQLKEYINGKGVKKIMCTYDKLPKMAEYLNISEFRLLIDEYHSLLKAYSYRDKAIDGVLNSFRDYKSFCFMSATPIQAEFKPDCLNGIEEIVAKWNKTDRILVKLDKTNKPYTRAANIIDSYKQNGYIEINGIKSYEAFFFINSVSDIAAILEHCQLNNDEVRIICADNEKNRISLAGYSISNSTSKNKQFNFITSKSFEGADYFSETGMCYVVSNPSNSHTLVGIDTDIPQIAGRIRTKTNPFRNIIIHIFNTTKTNLNLDISSEEMMEITNKVINETKDVVNYFNDAPKPVKDRLRDGLRDKLNDLYMSYDKGNDKFMVNDLLPKLELYNYKLNKIIYSNGLEITKEYNSNNIDTTDIEYTKLENSINKNSKKLSFKDAFIKYVETTQGLLLSPETDDITRIQPLVAEAYHKLGVDKVRNLKYVKSAVENALLLTNKNKNTDNKIAIALNRVISTGFISSNKIKDILGSIYSEIGETKKPKSTDIENWFECKPSLKWIDNKSVRGYNIYRQKSVFK